MLHISVLIPFPSFLSSFLSLFLSSFLFFDSTSDNRFYTSLDEFAMKLNQECCLESVLFRVIFSIVSSCDVTEPGRISGPMADFPSEDLHFGKVPIDPCSPDILRSATSGDSLRSFNITGPATSLLSLSSREQDSYSDRHP